MKWEDHTECKLWLTQDSVLPGMTWRTLWRAGEEVELLGVRL